MLVRDGDDGRVGAAVVRVAVPDFALEPPDRGVLKVEAKIKEEDRPITLSTIHSAKGLAWEMEKGLVSVWE